jgi:hypothetical protein
MVVLRRWRIERWPIGMQTSPATRKYEIQLENISGQTLKAHPAVDQQFCANRKCRFIRSQKHDSIRNPLGWPNLPAGICLTSAARSSSDLPEWTAVMIGPALTAFTRIPREINSPESVLVNEMMAAFVAE